MNASRSPHPDAIPVPAVRRLPAPWRAFLIALLVSALLAGLIMVIQVAAPRPVWRFLFAVVFLVALESIYTTRWLRHPDRRQLNRTAYRLAELSVLGISLRLLTWILAGGIPGAATWRGYLLSPLSFVDGTFLIFLLAAVLAWERSIAFTTLFEQLALSPAELAYYSLTAEQQSRRPDDRPIQRDRSAVFSALLQQWVGGGFLLALAAAITTVDLASVANTRSVHHLGRLGLPGEMLGALLLYFLLGMWLISQARLMAMRARWLADGVDAAPTLIRTWNRTTLLLLLLIAVAAAFLPIGSTVGFAPLFQLLFGLALSVVQLFFLIVTFFIFLLLSLFGVAQREGGEVLEIPQAVPTPAVTQTQPLSEATALVLGTLFWVMVAGVALVAVLFFLQDRGVRLDAGALGRWWSRLRAWLRSHWQQASRHAASFSQAVQARLRIRREEGGSSRSPWRFVRVNALPPREQIRYFYLSTVRRAREQGVERAASETPREYARDLEENWPEAKAEIETLTGAFMEARYSRRPFSTQDLGPVKRVWKQVRATFKRGHSRFTDRLEQE